MTSGGWHSQEQRHGRHRQGATGAAWTPVVRPTDTGPAHAVRDGSMPVGRPSDTAPPVSEVLTRRPGWPEEPAVPAARRAADIGRAWPGQRQWRPELERARPAPEQRSARPTPVEPVWPVAEPVEPRKPVVSRPARHAAPPKRKMISADMVLDTVPMGPVRNVPVVYALPETPATGLRKFDLGNIPASVTPPRSWRRAAWFAVGTSAAVVLGLAVAAAELIGRPVSDNAIIDALPEYPTGPLTLEKLPNHHTTNPPPSGRPTTASHGRPAPSQEPTEQQDAPPKDTVTGHTSTGAAQTSDAPSTGQDITATTTPAEPVRRTVGPAPVTPTDPQAMGDRTEEYFQLVISDPAAAHAMTSGGMAREGAEGIEARYAGIRRVEVQDITIDRNQAITTSTVKIVHTDGTETIEHRRLTFTWGGDPKITDDVTTQ